MRVTGRKTAAAMAVAMAAMMGTVWAQGKGKPTIPPDAVGSVTLADRATDELTSDGGQAYPGAILYGSGTLRLDLALGSRHMWINLRPENRTVTAGSAVDHVAPGTYATDAVLMIENIDNAGPNGTWGRTVGRIGFGQALPNHALGFRYATANGVPVYGTDVCVRRVVDGQGRNVTPATWVVASSEACAAGEQGNAGLFEDGLKGKGYRFEAVYQVRFEATVVCTSGSTCPQ